MTDDLRTRIAAVIYEASDEYTRKLMANPRLPGCADIEGDSKPICFTLADAVIRELPELPVKISAEDQLDALPFLTVVREVRKPDRNGMDYGGIYERRTSGWQCIAGTWVEPERNGPPMLPVMVLWRGKDAE